MTYHIRRCVNMKQHHGVAFLFSVENGRSNLNIHKMS
ncbi:hypothetical protein FUAX_38370 (plasmid) [Fulvitalea axinellae]|uniref:Uncharacterized protein n=1 Tax=Fulvitalea axinellae TaxID=1182444 RepID=A0AAU9CPT4_9BACT|nr:hypothetical protein FUAX_38370 [Fulvitalea axinellae]